MVLQFSNCSCHSDENMEPFETQTQIMGRSLSRPVSLTTTTQKIYDRINCDSCASQHACTFGAGPSCAHLSNWAKRSYEMKSYVATYS